MLEYYFNESAVLKKYLCMEREYALTCIPCLSKYLGSDLSLLGPRLAFEVVALHDFLSSLSQFFSLSSS